MNPKQREVFAEKLMDVGNIAAGALIFGQFFSEQGFRWELTLLGLAVMAGLYTYAYFLLRFENEGSEP
jgi:hypothetical protein